MMLDYTGVNTYILEILKKQFKKDNPNGTEEEFKGWVQGCRDLCGLVCPWDED